MNARTRAAVPVPFGITENKVFPLVVLVCTINRLLIVALDISPVMRWAVDEKVRLPEAESVVNAPVFGVLAPIGGIVAAMFVNVSL